mgnify:CR=1 FL=1
MNTVAIVQARMGSTRLPKKVMKKINSVPIIGLLLNRLSKSKRISEIVLATSREDSNKPLIDYVSSIGIPVECGSEDNVLERFYNVAKKYEADVIVRITGDCPLVDPKIVDSLIEEFVSNNVNYASNVNPPTFPDGLDVEVISFNSLKRAYTKSKDKFDIEHVTPFIIRNEKKQFNLFYKEDFSGLRWTVDESKDLKVVEKIFNNFYPNIHFDWEDALKFHHSNGFIAENENIIRNQGLTMKKGPKLYKRAKEIIPGGNMLLSKRPEMFLPDQWPAYFSKSKGCNVWDLDKKKYIDMSLMGIGTNILGYGHKRVDDAVQSCIQNGNMSTLNCPEEVFLAEKLIEINPWAQMVRFARTGGEANSIAIRIARAASGKDNVAICGYHGWHDWYLSANFSNEDKLDAHLLPGLETNGVPKSLKDTVHPFHYNNFEELEKIVKNKNIGAIKMEVERNNGPKEDFLQKVRKLATDNNIILIFDECTSGFRETFGGLHIKYGIEPDMAIFGKALGNGYAVTATVGKKEIMEAAQSTFISSTFWTERIGSAAALKTLEVMEDIQSWEKISEIGESIKSKWHELSTTYNLEIEISGLKSLPIFSFMSNNHQVYKTFITQEMLKKGFLAGNSVYVCIDHSEKIIDAYFNEMDLIFKKIKEYEEGKRDIDLLNGPISHSGFARLN